MRFISDCGVIVIRRDEANRLRRTSSVWDGERIQQLRLFDINPGENKATPALGHNIDTPISSLSKIIRGTHI